MTSLLKKLSISIKIGVIKRYGVCLVVVEKRLLLGIYSAHRPSLLSADNVAHFINLHVTYTYTVCDSSEFQETVSNAQWPTRQNSFVASAVCIGHNKYAYWQILQPV